MSQTDPKYGLARRLVAKVLLRADVHGWWLPCRHTLQHAQGSKLDAATRRRQATREPLAAPDRSRCAFFSRCVRYMPPSTHHSERGRCCGNTATGSDRCLHCASGESRSAVAKDGEQQHLPTWQQAALPKGSLLNWLAGHTHTRQGPLAEEHANDNGIEMQRANCRRRCLLYRGRGRRALSV